MKILVVLFVFIHSDSFTIEATKNRVHVIPKILKKDPWLMPKEGILVTQYTPVYRVKRGSNGQVLFYKIPNAIENVATHLSHDGKYVRANVENIVNSNNHLIPNYTIPVSLPWGWPKVIYPKIMVVVANDLYRILGSKLRDTIPYVLAFWNGVDMMFRSITNPKIRLYIAGIILETKNGMLDYLRTDFKYLKHISGNAIYGARKFWYQHDEQIPLESYDNIVTMTARNICANGVDVCDQLLEGQSWMGSMCSDASNQNETENVIIIQDNGKFSGIPTAAHELGHSFGIAHDGDEKFRLDEELEKFPHCRNVSSGYIMDEYLSATVYERRWSQCSLDQLTKFIEEKKPTCLYDPPITRRDKKKIINIPRLLPGKLATLDDQCRAYGYEEASVPQIEPCKYLECMGDDDYDYYYLDESFTVAEGTPCDEDDRHKFCMFGKCVSAAAFT